jgi:UDP:flavonoid glycosyltransferase YjiC (YdhE family)
MKVLIATMPFTGHVNPFQRVAAELVRRGHSVIWLTGDDFREKVEITGATFVSPSNLQIDRCVYGLIFRGPSTTYSFVHRNTTRS